MTTENNILREAEKIIWGDREKTYGRPDKNLASIARLWTVYLINHGIALETPLTGDDVAIMMVLLKIARLQNTPRHRDSLIDACGYMALIERIDEYEQGDEA